MRAMSRLSMLRAALTLAAVTIMGAGTAEAWPAQTTAELAVREGPATSYPHIEVVPSGVVLNVHFCNEGGAWCKVAAPSGTVGYVRHQFLARLGDVYRGPSVGLYVGVAPGPYYHPGPRHGYGAYYGRRW